MSTLNIQSLCRISKKIPKLSLSASYTGAMIIPQWLELPMSRTNFHSPKDVQAIVQVYNISYCKALSVLKMLMQLQELVVAKVASFHAM